MFVFVIIVIRRPYTVFVVSWAEGFNNYCKGRWSPNLYTSYLWISSPPSNASKTSGFQKRSLFIYECEEDGSVLTLNPFAPNRFLTLYMIFFPKNIYYGEKYIYEPFTTSAFKGSHLNPSPLQPFSQLLKNQKMDWLTRVLLSFIWNPFSTSAFKAPHWRHRHSCLTDLGRRNRW